MYLHARKITRRSLLRGLGAGALALAAIPVLGDLTGGTAFAQTTVTGVRASGPSTAGGLIVKPALGSSIAKINAKYRTTTVFTFTGTDQALLWSTNAAATAASMRQDPLLVAWIELNTRARKVSAS